MSLDRDLSDAKARVTTAFARAVSDPSLVTSDLPQAVDELNKAWDALTDRLVAQRSERDEEIFRLLNLLAERRGNKR